MLDASDITLHFGGRCILREACLRVEDGERACIVGPNGSGKSTLLKIIAGQQSREGGSIVFPNNSEVGYLPQHLEMTTDQSVGDACREVFSDAIAHEAEMRQLEHEMGEVGDHESPRFHRIADRYALLQHELERRDFHTMDAQIGRILAGLGFHARDIERACNTFSGGWQMRIALARLLLQNPDILLLDEPTNHLDIESIEWLAQWIEAHHGSVVLVSHERAFMDRLCTKTAALEGSGRLIVYRKNYTQSLEARRERREMQRRAWENQQQEIQQIQRFIDRFRYQASKASVVQSRVKALERMERVDPPPPDDTATIRIRFPQPDRSAKEVVTATEIWKSYGDNVVLRGIDFNVYRGEKVALVGVNGAGKSTLMKLLAAKLDADRGRVALGGNVAFEYFAQYEYEDLNPNRTVLEEFFTAAPLGLSGDARSILGSFLFEGDDVEKPVRVLSGGERTRLRLAKMLCSKANLLLLDEPTNHLDIASRLTLERALREFEGTVVIVSHDRYLLDAVPTRVVEIAGGMARSFPGNYSDYLRQREGMAEPAAPPPPDDEEPEEGNGRNGKNENDGMEASHDSHTSHSSHISHDAAPDAPPPPRPKRDREAELQRLAAELSSTPRKLTKDQRRRAQKDRQEWSKKLAKAERRVRETEAAIADCETRIRQIDRNMTRPEVASNSSRLVELAREQDAIRAEMAPLYEEWERAQTWLESLKREEPEGEGA